MISIDGVVEEEKDIIYIYHENLEKIFGNFPKILWKIRSAKNVGGREDGRIAN